MDTLEYNLLLADDDIDDCIFFKEVLGNLPVSTTLTIVNDGVQLMQWLSGNRGGLPDVLFLDLNMPLKTGIECLSEIKLHDTLKHLPVIIFSTSLDTEVVNILYETGAHYYIRKPGEFSKLEKVIFEALTTMAANDAMRPDKDKFVLEA